VKLVEIMAFEILSCWIRPLHDQDIFEKAAALMEISGPESPAQYYFYAEWLLIQEHQLIV